MPMLDDKAGIIGENIRRLRLKSAWSQEDLADFAGVRLNTLQDIEAGRREPKLQTQKKLAEALQVSPDDLAHSISSGEDVPNIDHKKSSIEQQTEQNHFETTNIAGIMPLLNGNSEIMEWVTQTARIAAMINRRETMYTMMGTVLACVGMSTQTPTAHAREVVQSMQYGLEGGKIGSEVAEWARDQIKLLSRLDDQIGGKPLYPIARSNLGLLQNLLQMRAVTGDEERDLRLTLAHVASQAG